MKSSAINVGIAIGAGFVAVAEAGALKWGFAVDERSYTPAQQTAPGFMIDMASATSPKPTKAPEAARFEIRKRQASQGFDTCGFINGIQGLSITCGGGDACIYNSIASKIGCCPLSSTACPIATTCLDSSQSALFTTDNGLTIFCGQSAFPFCQTYVYYDAVFSGYTALNCDSAGGVTSVFYTPVTGGVTTFPTTRRTSTISTSTAATPTPTPTPPANGGGSVNAGAIAGGVVGGLAAVVLIIGAIMFFVRRGQSKDSSAANGNGVTSQSVAGSGPSPPPPTSPSPAYNSGVPASLNSTAPLVGGGASGGTFYDNRASMVQPPQYGYEQQRTPSPQPQMQQMPYGMQQPMQPNQFLQPGQYPNSPTSAFAQPTQQQTYYGSPGSGPSSSGTENAAYFSPLTPQQMHHMPELDSTEANLNAPKEMAA